MNQLSLKSKQKLSLADSRHQNIFNKLAETELFEIVHTYIDPKEYLILKARGVTDLTSSESLFCKQPTKCVVAVPYVNGSLSWNLHDSKKFRDKVYATAKELNIYVKCGRNQLCYCDITDLKNHYFELLTCD